MDKNINIDLIPLEQKLILDLHRTDKRRNKNIN